MAPSDPGQMATVLVAFAIVEGSPTHTSAGNDTSVPPPATELMAPAMNAAMKTTMYGTGTFYVQRVQWVR